MKAEISLTRRLFNWVEFGSVEDWCMDLRWIPISFAPDARGISFFVLDSSLCLIGEDGALLTSWASCVSVAIGI